MSDRLDLDMNDPAARGIKTGAFKPSGDLGSHAVDQRQKGTIQKLERRRMGIMGAAFEHEAGWSLCRQQRRQHGLQHQGGAPRGTDREMVLTRPEPVQNKSALDPKKYGVIVESGWRRGLLLPDLEGVDSVEDQIDICRQKGGIGPHEPVQLYRFEVKRYK